MSPIAPALDRANSAALIYDLDLLEGLDRQFSDSPAAEPSDIIPLLRNRRSTRAFAHRSIEMDKLFRVFEAARWAPSSGNEQPWRFIVATRDEEELYRNLLGVLNESNVAWAQNAPVLFVSIAKTTRGNDGSENRHAYYDVGQAVGHLTVQALEEGLTLRQMGGFNHQKAREVLRIPHGFEPVSVIALGYADDPETLPDSLYERELAPRTRRPLEDTVFVGYWDSDL